MNHSTFTVTVDSTERKVVFGGDGQASVDGIMYRANVDELKPGILLVHLNNRIVKVSVEHAAPGNDATVRSGSGYYDVTVDGMAMIVRVDDERSLLLRTFLKSQESETGVSVIRAPMPGLVVKIEIETGTAIIQGQGLLILEAMKMENEIRALKSGTVDAVHVRQGKAVEKGEPLLTIRHG